MKVRHRRPVNIREFNDEILTRQSVHLEARCSRPDRHDGPDPILGLSVRNDLQLITPGAFPLQPQAASTLWFHLIALDFPLATR